MLALAGSVALAFAAGYPSVTTEGANVGVAWRSYRAGLRQARNMSELQFDLGEALPYAIAMGARAQVDGHLKRASADGYAPAWFVRNSAAQPTGFYPYWVLLHSSLKPFTFRAARPASAGMRPHMCFGVFRYACARTDSTVALAGLRNQGIHSGRSRSGKTQHVYYMSSHDLANRSWLLYRLTPQLVQELDLRFLDYHFGHHLAMLEVDRQCGLRECTGPSFYVCDLGCVHQQRAAQRVEEKGLLVADALVVKCLEHLVCPILQLGHPRTESIDLVRSNLSERHSQHSHSVIGWYRA